MIFYALTSAGPETPPEGPNRCFKMYQKSMFDRYYCIKVKHKTFFRSKILEKLLQKIIFTCADNGVEKQITCERFENAASRTKTNAIATVHFTDDDVSFYDDPGMLICKTAKPCINSM